MSYQLLKAGDVPEYDGFYYNYDQQIAQILNIILRKEKLLKPIFLTTGKSPFPIKAIQHLCEMLPIIKSQDINLFWFTAYENTDCSIFASELRKFLLQSLLKNISTYSTVEQQVLTFEFGDSEDIDSYFNRNIKGIFSRAILKEFFIVADLTSLEGNNSKQAKSILYFIENLLIMRSSNRVYPLILLSGNNDGKDTIDFPEVSFSNSSETSTMKYPLRIITDSRPNQSLKAMKDNETTWDIIHPLILLNQTAGSLVVEYIRNNKATITDQITDLIKMNILRELYHGGISLEISHLEYLNNSFIKNSHYSDSSLLKANSSKILSFQPVEKLLTLENPVKSIDQYLNKNFLILDNFACLLNDYHKNNTSNIRYFNDKIQSLIKERENFNISNEEHTKTIINYLSQLLLTDRYSFGLQVFDLLQEMTYGYCSYLEYVYPESSMKKMEASRWVYKLGYIYDNLLNKKALVSKNIDRAYIYTTSAEFLAEAEIHDDADYLSFAYRRATALRKSQVTDLAAEEAIKAAVKVYNKSSTSDMESLVDQIFPKYLIYDLASYGISRTKKQFFREDVDTIIEDFRLNTGLVWDTSKITEHLQNPQVKSFSFKEFMNIDSKDDVSIHYCRPDFFSAILIASHLFFEHNLFANINLIENYYSIINSIECINHTHIILGAPDTPDGIGTFVSSLDETSKLIYQLRMGNDFCAPFDLQYKGNKLIILMASGNGGIIDAWTEIITLGKFTLRHTRNIVEDKMLESFVFTVFEKAGNKLLELLINKITDKVVSELGHRTEKDIKYERKIIEETLMNFAERIRNSNYSSSPPIQDLDLDNLSKLSKISLCNALQANSLFQDFDSTLFTVLQSDVSYEEIISAIEMMIAISIQIKEVPKLTIKQHESVDSFSLGFRNLKNAAEHIVTRYNSGIDDQIDYHALNNLIIKAQNTIKNFSKLLINMND